MERNSIIARTLLFFAVYTAVVVVLMYIVGVPTTRRMNFVLLSTGIGTILALLISGMFPRFAWLCRVAQIAWIIIAGVALVSFIVTIVCFIGKIPLPLVSQQWYGISMALGFISSLQIRAVGQSYWKCYKLQNSSNQSGEPAMA